MTKEQYPQHTKAVDLNNIPENFVITYYAKKHGKFITRNGKWNDKCKYWFSKSLKPLITYFDVDANNYRTASGSYWIKRGGTNGDS